MSQRTKLEFVRILDDSPLTLACSALADFLWNDFVRESRPIVKYLTETYNIRQLSRFGKELFERLYKSDEVNWLVSEDDYETYFRQVSNGENAPLPAGYKPENGLWWAIMSDLTHAAGWPQLLQRSAGSQFNAGNNAVNILNELADVIEKAIDEQRIDIEVLIGSGEKLNELREQYKQAVANGDKEKAADARVKGKQLNQKLMEAIQQAKAEIEPATHEIVQNTIKQNDELEENMSNMFGSAAGTGRDCGNLEEKRELAKKLKKNTRLQQIARNAGALKRVWAERKRAKKTTANYDAITGARYGNDIMRAFPSEIALASTDAGRALFALKYSQNSLFVKDYTTQSKNLGKGPIVLYIDVSGSMLGSREIWSKALAFVIADQALKDKRKLQIYLFDTHIAEEVTLEKDRRNNKDLLDFVGSWTLGGGTAFNNVLAHAGAKGRIDPRADILMITDGESEVHPAVVKTLNQFKAATGTQWSTLCLNNRVPAVCRSFSDQVYAVDIFNENDTVDAIQKCIK